jgi:hypothetical protein
MGSGDGVSSEMQVMGIGGGRVSVSGALTRPDGTQVHELAPIGKFGVRGGVGAAADVGTRRASMVAKMRPIKPTRNASEPRVKTTTRKPVSWYCRLSASVG